MGLNNAPLLLIPRSGMTPAVRAEIERLAPSELFIHAKSAFTDNEWRGFAAGCDDETNLVGVQIESMYALSIDGVTLAPSIGGMIDDDLTAWRDLLAEPGENSQLGLQPIGAHSDQLDT